MINLKAVSRNVGYALLVSALFMLLSVGVSLANGHDSALAAMSISFLITFIVGIFPFIFVRKNIPLTLADGYVIIVLSWLLSFIVGMLPFALWGGPFTLVNAWFESVSGYTTTGATILSDVEILPKSLLFWRSAMHFIGGLGVVVFLLLIIPDASPIKLRLSSIELSSLSKDGYSSRAGKTVNIFTVVYLGLNVAAFFAYWLAGMSPFDAVCHAMSVCATGGFSTRTLSIAAFHSTPITLVSMMFMFLASIHFGIIFLMIVRRSLRPLNNPMLKVYVGLLVASSLMIAFAIKTNGNVDTWGEALLDGSFHSLSYASTTGFAIADNAAWPYFASIVLQVCGICCGMAGSTTGGVKTDRVVILWKEICRTIHHSLHPSSVTEIKISGKSLKDEDVYPHILYIALYFFIMFISVMLCLSFGVDNSNSLIATLSTLSNVGPGVGALGTFGNYGGEPAMAKIIYTINMFLGRVEIYPILAVIAMLGARRSSK